jgi:ABC-type uncharacterized transport system ATPase subunit
VNMRKVVERELTRAVFSDSPCIGIGVVVRNHFREFIFASCQKRHVFADPELA